MSTPNKYQPLTNTPLLAARKQADNGPDGTTQAVAQEVSSLSPGAEAPISLDESQDVEALVQSQG